MNIVKKSCEIWSLNFWHTNECVTKCVRIYAKQVYSPFWQNGLKQTLNKVFLIYYLIMSEDMSGIKKQFNEENI